MSTYMFSVCSAPVDSVRAKALQCFSYCASSGEQLLVNAVKVILCQSVPAANTPTIGPRQKGHYRIIIIVRSM